MPTPPGQPGTLPWYSLRNHGKHHVLPRYLSWACFDFWSKSAIIALIDFTKCSPFSWINWLSCHTLQCWMMGRFIFSKLCIHFYVRNLYVPVTCPAKGCLATSLLKTSGAHRMRVCRRTLQQQQQQQHFPVFIMHMICVSWHNSVGPWWYDKYITIHNTKLFLHPLGTLL